MELLVKQAQLGDSESFVQLMEQNKNSMRRIAYGFFSDEEDVADAVQETVLSAYEHLHELQKAAYFKTWLMRILINNCKQIYNKKKKICLMDSPMESGMNDTYPSEDGFGRLLSLLPRDSRVIFQLYYGEQLTTKEISHILQQNEATVRSKIHRGKAYLREQLIAEKGCVYHEG